MLQALIFDFDGLILDTETPLFSAWAQTYEHLGVEPIGIDEWTQSLGRSDDDPATLQPRHRLEARIGRRLDEAELAGRRARRDELVDALAIQPGVEELLVEAEGSGIPVGIATSSPPEWIDRHLGRRGLLSRFAFVSCAGNGVPGKPSPDVYRRACQGLGADPAHSLALEDSPHGLAAAKAAGLRGAVVPTELGRGLAFPGADVVLSSLLDLSLGDW